MALRSSGRRYGWEGEVGGDVGVIGLRGGYHGDTVSRLRMSDECVKLTSADRLDGRIGGIDVQHGCRLVLKAEDTGCRRRLYSSATASRSSSRLRLTSGHPCQR